MDAAGQAGASATALAVTPCSPRHRADGLGCGVGGGGCRIGISRCIDSQSRALPSALGAVEGSASDALPSGSRVRGRVARGRPAPASGARGSGFSVLLAGLAFSLGGALLSRSTRLTTTASILPASMSAKRRARAGRSRSGRSGLSSSSTSFRPAVCSRKRQASKGREWGGRRNFCSYCYYDGQGHRVRWNTILAPSQRWRQC
jgi:hypothetical protein